MLNVTSLLCDEAANGRALRAVAKPAGAAEDVPVPVVVWAVTGATNMPCSYCDAAGRDGSGGGNACENARELSFDEGVALLRDLRGFGVPGVVISGGEPLVRDDTLRLLEVAGRMGLACTLATNGMLLTDAVADAIAAAGVKRVSLPLEGKAETHDRLRGSAGAHGAALAAIDRCRRRGIRVAVQYTLTAQTRPDLGDVFDACIDHDVCRLTVHHLAHAQGEKSALALSTRQTRLAMDELFARARACFEAGSDLEVSTVGNTSDAGYLLLFLQKHDPALAPAVRKRLEALGGNPAGRALAAVDPTGGVHFDPADWSSPVGNVRLTPFSTVWREARDPRLALLRNRTPHLPTRCQACQFVSMCNGNSRSRAEQATGNFLGVDPACYLFETERFSGSN